MANLFIAGLFALLFSLENSAFCDDSIFESQMRYLPLVEHHAPNFYHEIDDGQKGKWDFIRRINYDGDFYWHNSTKKSALVKSYNWDSVIYWYAQETESHYFLMYQYYHPYDVKFMTDHPNDLEGVLLKIAKDGSEFGSVEAASTMAHFYFRTHTTPEAFHKYDSGIIFPSHPSLNNDKNDRVSIFIEKTGHGTQGPTHLEYSAIEGSYSFKEKARGVVYSFEGARLDRSARNQTDWRATLARANTQVQHFHMSYSLVNHFHPSQGIGQKFIDCIVERTLDCDNYFNGDFYYENENPLIGDIGKWGPLPGKFGSVDFSWTYKGGRWGIDPAEHWRNELKDEYKDLIDGNYIENPVLEALGL